MPQRPSHPPPEIPGGGSLRGQRVLVTRASHQVGELIELLVAEGAQAVVLPVIRITDPPDWAPADAALAQLASYDWVVFSSSNGVRAVVDRLAAVHGGLACLGQVALAAVGPGTAEAIRQAGLDARIVPETHRAEGLVQALAPRASGRRFLLARANRGRDVLAEGLRAAGARVDEMVVYSSEDVPADSPEIGPVAEELRQGRIDWVTITSSAIARAAARLLGEDLRHAKLASMSPITSETLRELGFSPAAQADPHTLPGLVAAMRRDAS
ncbi:MAG: uroporphyrinogen-III synthase [Pirellulales bacterium]|nr:uroporphyrinogen-III synthase [Pirellulales bacterium]